MNGNRIETVTSSEVQGVSSPGRFDVLPSSLPVPPVCAGGGKRKGNPQAPDAHAGYSAARRGEGRGGGRMGWDGMGGEMLQKSMTVMSMS